MASSVQTGTAIQACVLTEFHELPKKRLTGRCCLIRVKEGPTAAGSVAQAVEICQVGKSRAADVFRATLRAKAFVAFEACGVPGEQCLEDIHGSLRTGTN